MPQNQPLQLDQYGSPPPRLQPENSSLRDQAIALAFRTPNPLKTSSTPATTIDTASAPQKEYAQKLEQFVTDNFAAIDENHDTYLSKAELKLYSLRSDIKEGDKKMANLIVRNYDDLNRLTDGTTGVSTPRWEALNFKGRDELTAKDFSMLRIASDAVSRRRAVVEKQTEGIFEEYLWSGSQLALGGTLIAAGFASFAGPKVAGPVLLAGAAVGFLAGVGVTAYMRSNYLIPGCEKYYESKKNLSTRILDKMIK